MLFGLLLIIFQFRFLNSQDMDEVIDVEVATTCSDARIALLLLLAASVDLVGDEG